LDIIDEGGFQKLVVFNGWIGFLAGAYQVRKRLKRVPTDDADIRNLIDTADHKACVLQPAGIVKR
jgi:hypothetical protein